MFKLARMLLACMFFCVVAVSTSNTLLAQTAEGTVITDRSSTSVSVSIAGASAKDIFQFLLQTTNRQSKHYREVKSDAGNIVCGVDADSHSGYWCAGSALTDVVEGEEAKEIFERLPLYGPGFLYGDLYVLSGAMLRCSQMVVSDVSSFKCDTSVLLDGSFRAKHPAMIGFLN